MIEGWIMPSWLLLLLAFCAIAGFIGFAFWQGAKVKPDKNNTDRWDRFGGPPDSHTGSGMSFLRLSPQVRYGSKPVLTKGKTDFRITPESRHSQSSLACLKGANFEVATLAESRPLVEFQIASVCEKNRKVCGQRLIQSL